MSILTKLNTLLRAGARESVEHITDANALRIYRQEIIDAENMLQRRRLALAGLIATRKDLEREMSAAQQRIETREQQIASIDPRQRSEDLLMLAARDIAATQAHVAELTQRHTGVVERVGKEELTLRKLLAEIREHRREIRILAADVARTHRSPGNACGNTVASQLATLRETRASIATTASDSDVAEESYCEAEQRLHGDPLERELAAQGRDAATLQLETVLAKLRVMPGPASPV